MAQSSPLSRFVETALTQGRPRDEIRQALTDAGWSDQEAEDALSAFADTSFTPPVPRPRPVVSARDFFIYALIAASLGIAAYNLVQFLQAMIDTVLSAQGATEGVQQGSMRSRNRSLAGLIVFAPICVWLTRSEAKQRAADPARDRSAIRNWTIAAIQLIAILSLLGAVSWAIYILLQEGFDLRSLLKVAASAAVAGGVCWLYRKLPDRLS